ncbi:hypothetical protein Chor_010190 [Crotalus horridus]
MARTFLKMYNVENEKHPIKEEDDWKKTLRNIQDNLRPKLSKRGVRIVSGVGKYFRELDKKQNGNITKADYKQALKVFHLEVTEEEFESLWLVLHDDNNGEIDYTEFIRAILGEMNEYRKIFVRKKIVSVKVRNATEEEIKSSFLETLEDACSNPSEVSFGEFEDYYEGLSIGILDDEDFINVLRNPWGI